MEYEYGVDVPATSANFGACFDFAGLAIPDLCNSVMANVSKAKTRIKVEGIGKGIIPTDERNLIYKTCKRTFEYAREEMPALDMLCINRIPLNRGLGSSAAATLGGIFIANKIMGNKLSNDEMLSIACEFEGHPDNAAPAIYGGIIITTYVDGKPVIRRIKTDKNLFVAVAVPEIMLSTSVSRSVLPQEYSRQDVVKAMSTAALAVDALRCSDFETMGKLIMQDVVHIPYRKSLITGYDDVVAAAVASGAYGCVISGAGSTMISYCGSMETARRVSNAMLDAFKRNSVNASAFASEVK